MENENIEKTENLFKPGNEEALKSALNEEIDDLEKTAVGSADQNKSQASDKSDDEDGDDQVETARKNRMADILADRNAVREASAKEAENKIASEKRMEEMQRRIDQLEGKGSSDNDDTEDEKPLTKSELDKILAEREKALNADKSDIQDVDDYIAKNPKASDYKDDMLSAMKAHPTITAYGAYKLVAEEDITPTNTRKLQTSGRSKSDLRKGAKNPNKMTNAELAEEVAKGVASGDIRL